MKLFTTEDIDEIENFYTSNINWAIDVCAPWTTRKLKRKQFRLPESVQKEIRKTKVLQKQHHLNIENGVIDEEHERIYKKQNNYTNNLINKTVKQKRGEKVTAQSSTQQIWKCINDILRPLLLTRNSYKMEKDGKIIDNPEEMAELYNEFFYEKPINLARKISQDTEDPLEKLKNKL